MQPRGEVRSLVASTDVWWARIRVRLRGAVNDEQLVAIRTDLAAVAMSVVIELDHGSILRATLSITGERFAITQLGPLLDAFEAILTGADAEISYWDGVETWLSRDPQR